MSKSKRHSFRFDRRSRFEFLEERIVLDTQIGTVTMPYAGYLSAAVYDSNGQIVRTLLERAPASVGTVTLTWDGIDDLGRAVIQDGTYNWKAFISQVQIVDNGGVGETGYDPNNYNFFSNMGYFVQSLAINMVGGTSGDIGGTFARNDNESYYGDTNLSQSFSLETPIAASGRFLMTDATTMQGKFFVGHFSQSTANNRREFIGLEFAEGDYDEAIDVRARIFRFNGDPVSDAYSNTIVIPVGAGYFNWDYSYDPSYESDGSHVGPEGRLTVNIYNNNGVSYTLYADNAGTHRDAGSTFDAFGIGITTQQAFTGDNPNSTAKVYVDDVSYSGHTGTLNFTTNPGWTAVGNTTDGNNYGWNQYNNIDNSLYMASYVEEGTEINKVSQNGTWGWVSGDAQNFGIGVDEQYTYVTRRVGTTDQLFRYFSRDGYPAPFAPGVPSIVINANAPDSRPADQPDFTYTADQWRTLASTWGVAADGYRIWVTNYRNNRIEVYNRDTGALLGQFSVTKPMAIAVDSSSAGSATVWVTNNGDRATKISYNGSFSATTTISGLSDPTGIAIGGPNHHLFVAESGLTRIGEYDISSTPSLAGLQHFGSKHGGGTPLGDTQFYWDTFGNTTSLAIDSTGILSVNDDHRIQRFYTVTSGGHNAGDLYQSMFSEFAPAPQQTYNYSADGKHYLVSNRYIYEVDPNYTSGPRTGWMGDGSWRLVNRFYVPRGQENLSPGKLITLMDGATPRQYFYLTNGDILALEPTGQRLSAIVGYNWKGPDQMKNPQAGQFNWTDTDGDGQVDWNGIGSGTDGEVKWYVPLGQPPALNTSAYTWVDTNGTIWFIDTNSNICKLSVEGFDAAHNPIYNWAHSIVVIPYDSTGLGFVPRQVHVAANGEILAFGSTKVIVGSGAINNGGDWIAVYNSSGTRLLLQPSPDLYYSSIALDDTDSTPDYYFVGSQNNVYMYTIDGLLVQEFTDPKILGWRDHPYSLDAFTNPLTNKTYLYSEEDYLGKSNLYRVDNLNSVQRQQGNFNFTHATGPNGQWAFENNLNDSVGPNNGTFVGGSPVYTTGKVGTGAIDLDGVDDYVNIPYASDFYAYTISAWIKATDTSSVNILDRTRAFGGFSDQLFITANGKFEHYTLDGVTQRTIIGTTTVQPNVWYHVAIVADNNGMMKLFVNGQEEGVSQDMTGGLLWTYGDQFHLGEAIPGLGLGYFDGQIDDLRVYNYALTTTQIQAIVGPTVYVNASDNTTAEAGPDVGVFTIGRTTTSGSQVINYTLSGSAVNGVDYSSLTGTVTIPNGSSTVNITVVPIDDSAIDPSENIILTLTPSSNYTVGSPDHDTITITDNDAIIAGQAGGIFARNDDESYYGDTHLSQTYTLETPISASGVFTVSNAENMHGKFFVGHFSSATDFNRREFIGMELFEGDADGFVGVRARIMRFNGTAVDDVYSDTYLNIIGGTGYYHFEYNYDPSYEGDTSHAGPEGRLMLHVYNDAGTVNQTMYAVNAGTHRDAGSTFDSFGMGISTLESMTGDDPNSTAKMFIDDVSYSGHSGIVNFNTDPGWTGVGNTISGNNYGFATQTTSLLNVTASDPNAAEQGQDPGVFTINRGIITGNLTVFYTLSGSATNNADYSSLTGSVVIPNGSSAVNITVTPIDDPSPESNETVTLTLSANANYGISSPNNATITIADNDSSTGLGFATNPGYSGSNRTSLGNNFGWQPASSQAGGTLGEIGGTFARATSDAYFGDTFLTQSFNLSNTITGSGKFDLLNITSGWAGSGNSGLFIGHYSINATNNEFIGLELKNDSGGLTTQMQARARLQLPGGAGTAFSSWVNVTVNGNHTFSYTYNPSLGTNGRLTLQIDALSPLTVDLSAADRTSGSSFNGFGLGYTSNLNSENAPAKTAQVFLDDLQYSGYQPSVSVAATDNSAAEQGLNPGVFTITRTNTTGDLVVNYLLTGNAINGTDYATLPSSVTILNGLTSATITVTPVNDNTAEGDESVVLSLISGSGYHLSTPSNAIVKLADNDLFAMDNFENGNGAGGMGWNGAWTFGGTATVTSAGSPNTGSFHLQLTGNGATATRAVSLAGAASARVVFDWKASSFETGETAVVEVFDGTNWLNLLTINAGQADGIYHHADLTVPAAARNANFQLRIRSAMSSADDLFYVDSVLVVP